MKYGEGNGNPLQFSWLENPMDGEAWEATVHGVAKSGTWLSNFTFTFQWNKKYFEYQYEELYNILTLASLSYT